MYLSTLQEWLDWINKQYRPFPEIELGLTRVREVAKRLNLLTPRCPVITVGGTNGKGSTVAGLEAIYLQAGYKVGAFTTPYLFQFREIVRINRELSPDEGFISAYEQIEAVRGDVYLTPFEYNTLAALWLFRAASLDIILLEVGLGGRLDAVNIIDPLLSIITSISIDHIDYLGPTRESIGFEKAGILRAGQIAICADPHPPSTLLDYAQSLNTPLLIRDRDFFASQNGSEWDFHYKPPASIAGSKAAPIGYNHLPLNQLAVDNMATVVMAITHLQERFPVLESQISDGLAAVTLPGRWQIIEGPVLEIHDVAHNPASVEWLAQFLQRKPWQGKTYAVFSMLRDKDILTSITMIKKEITQWFVAPLSEKRGATLSELLAVFKAAEMDNVQFEDTIENAYQAARKKATTQDRIVIFGSFHTLGALFQK